jgi:hypothetical protein
LTHQIKHFLRIVSIDLIRVSVFHELFEQFKINFIDCDLSFSALAESTAEHVVKVAASCGNDATMSVPFVGTFYDNFDVYGYWGLVLLPYGGSCELPILVVHTAEQGIVNAP